MRGASYQQELNLDRLFADVSAYVQETSIPPQVRHVTDRAIRIAIAGNAVSTIILPKDVQDSAYEEPAQAHALRDRDLAIPDRLSCRGMTICDARPTF